MTNRDQLAAIEKRLDRAESQLDDLLDRVSTLLDRAQLRELEARLHASGRDDLISRG